LYHIYCHFSAFDTIWNETDPPKAETNDERTKTKESEENARKSREAADRLFPGEEWEKVEDGIYRSSRKKTGKNTNYKGELKDAQILRNLGNVVYLVPEKRTNEGNYDAIVNGLEFEFKNVGGNANTLATQFLRSRAQAPNVFINLECSAMTSREVISTLYNARNKQTHVDHDGNSIKGYDDSNKFSGGRIILKLRGKKSLTYLDADDLKRPSG